MEQNKPIKNRHNEEAGIDIRQLIKRCRQYWYIFLILPVTMTAIAWLFLKYQIPVYEVKSTILIKDEKNKQGVSATDLISKELGLTENKKMLADESKILTSHTVIEKVVEDLKLNGQVWQKGKIKSVELYGRNSPIWIDSIQLRDTTKAFKATVTAMGNQQFQLTTIDGDKHVYTFGNAFSNNYGSFIIRKKEGFTTSQEEYVINCESKEKTAREIIKTINIELPKKESNIFEPTIKSSIPEKAKDILQKMVEVYNEYNLNDKKEVSRNTLNFIEKRLVALTDELSGVERTVESYKEREGITDAPTDINYFFSRLGEYDGEMVKMEVQNNILNSIESILTKKDQYFDLLPTNLDLKSSNLQSLINDYNRIVLERNRLAKVAGEHNPQLKSLGDDIVNMKTAIIGSIRRVKQENANLLLQTKSKTNTYAQKLGKTPRNERELTDIKRQQNIKEGLYLFLLQKQEETAISMIGAVPDARVIDRPIIGEKPVNIKKTVVYIAALAIGLFSSLVIVTLISLFSKTVQSQSDIKSLTSANIINAIPFVKIPTDWQLQTDNRSALAESFRTLRSHLQYFLPSETVSSNGKVIVVTSASHNEGKSFVSFNLAMSLALADKKTVIVNLDLRRPRLTGDLAIPKGKAGIPQFLTSDLYPHEVIYPMTRHHNLNIVGSNTLPYNPSELMMHNKIGQLMGYLKLHYDYIIVHTPPVGLVADALSLKPFTDMTLYIVKQGQTTRSQMRAAYGLHEGQKMPNVHIVLNGTKENKKNSSYYYGTDLLSDSSSGFNKFSPVNWIKNTFS